MKRSVPLLFGTLLATLLSASTVRADFVSWSYNWSRTPQTVLADSGGPSGSIFLTDEPLGKAAGSSDIVATNLRTSSDALRGNPATFTNQAFKLTMFLLDDKSGES